jgi:MFS family permease
MLVIVAAGLGVAVIGMSEATGIIVFFATLTLVRGLGQGALSVVSMAMVGKWFSRRLPLYMGIYTVLLTFGLAASVGIVGQAVETYGWRQAWLGLGLLLVLVLGTLAAVFGHNMPNAAAEAVAPAPGNPNGLAAGGSLLTAIQSPSFWLYTLAMCLFNLAWSAITLFYEILLDHQGLDHDTYILVMTVIMATGLPANLLAGWLATRLPMGRVLSAGMVLLGAGLLLFPHVDSVAGAVLFGAAFGIAGGIITVIWFAIYGVAYGRQNLGTIQATAQVLTVFASAFGPVLLSRTFDATGSYVLIWYISAPLALVLAIGVWMVPLPGRSAEGLHRHQA